MEFRPLDKNDYKPLYAQLSERLTEYIQQNNLQPGDPIPSQNELEKHFEVSQMTIRLALQRLSSEGYIIRLQGRGTFVAEKKLSIAANSMVSFEDQMLNQGLEVENELLEENIVNSNKKRLQELKLPEGGTTYKVRRLKRVAGNMFCMEVSHMPPDVKGRFSPYEIAHVPFLTLFNRNSDTIITEIEYSIRSVLLLQVEADFLGVELDYPSLVKNMIFHTQNGPILSGKLVFLADKVEIRFKASQSVLKYNNFSSDNKDT